MARESALVFAADHPALAGHFPGAPIVPGVLLLDAALRAQAAEFGRVVAEIVSAKFLQPVLPGDALKLLCEGPDAAGRARFDLAAGAGRVATGQLLMQSGAA